MLPKGSEVAARTKLTVNEIIAWARKEFELPTFTVSYKLTGKSNRSWCRDNAIKPHIQIGVQEMMRTPVLAFAEYRSFNNYFEVGGFKTDDWRLWLDGVVAHEMAHAIQFALMRKLGANRFNRVYVPNVGYTESGHGNFFLWIYKQVRNRFVNDRVPRSAYTAPRQQFATEERVIASNHPLQGTVVIINRKRFELLGKDDSTRRQYAYKGKCLLTGTVYGLKLVDISKTPAANDIIQASPMLRAELAMMQAKAVRRAPRRRSMW